LIEKRLIVTEMHDEKQMKIIFTQSKYRQNSETVTNDFFNKVMIVHNNKRMLWRTLVKKTVCEQQKRECSAY